ncbi:MAG: hypothetical protein J6P46_07915 [Bacteroidales bacterium]|nr:hypothetical protein [Bacteroidales bacterium]
MDKNRWKEPGFGRIVLGAVALGCAIMVGFVLGLRSGDRHPKQPPVPVMLSFSMPLPEEMMSRTDSAVVEPEAETQIGAEAEAEAETAAVSAEEPAAPQRAAFSPSQIAQGVEYLATHNQWNRDEMEKIPALQGLWDAVNTYQLDLIRSFNDQLASTPLTAILEGLERTPKTGYYAAKADHVITLSTYIKRLR